MSSQSNARGRKMVNMVLKPKNLDIPIETVTAPSIEPSIIEREPVCNILDLKNLWQHPFDYNDFPILASIEYGTSFKLESSAFQKQLDILNSAYPREENNVSLQLFLNEILPNSLFSTPIAIDINDSFDIEHTVNAGVSQELIMPSTCQQNIEIQMNAKINTQNTDIGVDESTSNNNLDIHGNRTICLQNENDVIDVDAPNGRRKDGKPRVRKHFEETVKVREEKKKKLKAEKFDVKPACRDTCKKKCFLSFSETERRRINNEFWDLNYETQGLFIAGLVQKEDIKRRLANSTLSRMRTYRYFFTDNESQHRKEVCKIFFLTTLGFHEKNDRRVLEAMKKLPNAHADKRGQSKQALKIDRNIITEHINSFNPAVAHYRRHHAPNRKYLPSDLNATMMYKDFLEKYPQVKVSYEVYRVFLKKDMNISFAQLGNEECETCESFKLHQLTCEDSISCSVCTSYNLHRTKYLKARTMYQEDVEQSANDEKAFYSADLQKIIMLPRIDMFKAVIFCPRLIAFNESFVPLGSTKPSSQPFAAVWHEAICGRRQEDIISAFRAFFLSKRDCTDLIVWADNCASQNKNWAFFTFLVHIVNSVEILANSITIKYLEPGHTFMSADHFHHQVENQLRKAKKVYDFVDFIDCVQLANSGKVTVKSMEVADFYKFLDHSSQPKLKKNTERIYLKDLVCVEVRRNSYNLHVKTEYDGNVKEIDFLKAKYLNKNPIPNSVQNTNPRGITQERKNQILSKLSDIIPANRLVFWQNIPTSQDSINLTEYYDIE